MKYHRGCHLIVVTEPLEQTKNRQMIAELPEGHKLLKDPSELAELTDAEDGKEFHEWSKDIGNQFAPPTAPQPGFLFAGAPEPGPCCCAQCAVVMQTPERYRRLRR